MSLAIAGVAEHPGLTEEEARRRLAAEGFNELPGRRRRGFGTIALEIVREPMILLLVSASSVYLALGDRREAIVLFASIVVVVAISIYQNQKTEHALEALKDLASPRALVIRENCLRRVPGRDVVRDDIVILSEGDRVPADALLLVGMSLLVDESLLTGESVSVRKAPAAGKVALARPGGDDHPYLYAGTLVVRGQGIARVTATGRSTEVGLIGRALGSITPEPSRLELEIRRTVRIVATIGITICVVVVVLYGLLRSDWLHGFLAGLTLAMAVLPEEFPIVLTIFLALGAWRISRQRVLTRRVAAIESLGAATVLCVDKTGTLTLNRMTLRSLVAGRHVHSIASDAVQPLPESVHEVLEYAILASQRDPADPMEQAIRETARGEAFQRDHMHRDWTIVREYALSPELLAVSHVWRSPNGAAFVVAAKGAPEAIIDLCHMSAARAEEVAGQVRSLAVSGLRVLGVARARFEASALPRTQHDFDFDFVGLLGLADPVRPGVTDAVRECREAGIRVVMITGDYAATAEHVAREIGLEGLGRMATGALLDGMDDAKLADLVRDVSIVARVVPEQKLRIVRALQSQGEIVAMTGDGVNDAPALAAAQIGIAMGSRGTDVAREAAALVLLDDDFSSIVRAVRLGRRIYDNLKKSMAYLLAVHVPIAGISLLPVLLGWPLVLLPVHIVFLELIIDPACSIAFEAEPEEEDVMKRPPRRPGDRLFSRAVVARALLQGALALAVTTAVFRWGLSERTSGEARALAFSCLVVANLGMILANRSRRGPFAESLKHHNAPLWAIVGGAGALLGGVLVVPGLRGLFGFPPLRLGDLLAALAAGAASVLWLPLFRAIFGRRRSPTSA